MKLNWIRMVIAVLYMVMGGVISQAESMRVWVFVLALIVLNIGLELAWNRYDRKDGAKS
jgi:uncharacterized membrane protein SirB2